MPAMADEQFEILLAEDNAEDAEMTMRALRRNNLVNQLHWVKDGAEALDYLFCTGAYAGRSASRPPKLVLLDIKMPRVDGIEVLRQMKSDASLRTVPVVILTSSREESDLISSYGLGANAYVVKPVDFDGFISAVSQLGVFWAVVNEPPPVAAPQA